MATNKSGKNPKIITGCVLICVSVLLFALSVVPKFAVTIFFCGLFGLAWYAMLIVALLVGVACMMGLKYAYNKKFTIFLCLFVGALVLFLHAVVNSKLLANNVGFTDYKSYLQGCYYLTSGVTVGGAVGGIFVYFIRCLLGIVGVYCVLIICMAIFGGLVIDYAIYGTTKTRRSVAVRPKKVDVNSSEPLSEPQELNYSSLNTTISSNEGFTLETYDPQQIGSVENDEPVIQTRSFAAQKLFGDIVEQDAAQQSEISAEPRVKSAKEILFGDRDIPDVSLPNDAERERWINNYRKEAQEDKPAEDLSDLFGGFGANNSLNNNNFEHDAFDRSINPNTGRDMGRDFSRDADRNPFAEPGRDFTRESSRNASRAFEDTSDRNTVNRGFERDNYQASDNRGGFRFDDEIDEQANEPRERRSDFGGRHNSPVSRLSQDRATQTPERLASNRGEMPSRFGAQGGKLGEGLQDKSKAQVPTFGMTSSGANNLQNAEARPRQDKQMGFKAVRYNSIPLSVFRVYQEQNADYSAEYAKNTEALEKVFTDFRINAKVINVVRGPKVTRYELSLPDGVPISRVLALQDNIAMETEARSRIRIEAPIPGKRAFGIELENEKPSMVGMRELLESPEFINCKDPLPIAIGKDINGKVIIKSLPKMVHLLVAGSTGSGKSIFIHTLMMSILYKYSPDDVRFIMVDPKRVEFSMYNNLPHLMFPEVVCEHDKALNSIKWCCKEMENRLQLLRNAECQNIDQYNRTQEVTTGRLPKMPYLVIVVDELAELMGSPMKKDFEAGIQRITQLGRAAGLHMVVATQRPSVDVVTGTIKNNMPTRIAFALASFADSKTVLDEGGAENLLGKGDMLFAPQDMNIKVRLQAAFCDNDEIRNAIRYVKENNECTYDEAVFKEVYAEKQPEANDAGTGGGGADDGDGMDEYMKLAVKFAMSTGKVSVSMLQRKFRIGFNRAARIVDQMNDLGLVGPSIGAKPRDFSITREQYQDLFGEDFDDSDPV